MPVNDQERERLHAAGSKLHSKLLKEGMFGALDSYTPEPEEDRIAYGEGYPIIGIEKFLGYFDGDWNIAYSPSISMTTDFSKAKAFCMYTKENSKDFVMLNGVVSDKYTARMEKALSKFKSINGINGSFKFAIKIEKRYDDAKGLGESAAVAAATARALISCTFGKNAASDNRFVSRYSRLVSGSGTRSSVGGISLWLSYPGIKEEECYGQKLDLDASKLAFFACPESSKIETINAHNIALASEFYSRWIEKKYERISKMIENLSTISVEEMGKAAQDDMFRLDSLMLSQGVFIHNEKSMSRIRKIISKSTESQNLHITADTGPSTVIISSDRSLLKELLSEMDCAAIEGKIPENATLEPNSKDLAEAALKLGSIHK
ncbi:MAG: mevalonate pyrophosphate decarboxylase [Candidatus Marsarchaeota archaeon]|nr:mevalonate pyrophosphate decarboxylase [Candidatus Marsarchaeota archaeon]